MSTMTLDPRTLEQADEARDPWSLGAMPWSESTGVAVAGDDDLDEDESYFLEQDDDDDDDEDYEVESDDDDDDDLDEDVKEADDEDEDL